MSKFTPGPWEIKLIKRVPCIFTSEFSNYDKWAIAKINNDEVGDRMANANLIAAAPEMYEVLNDILQTIKPQLVPYEFEAVQKVLKKARGES